MTRILLMMYSMQWLNIGNKKNDDGNGIKEEI